MQTVSGAGPEKATGTASGRLKAASVPDGIQPLRSRPIIALELPCCVLFTRTALCLHLLHPNHPLIHMHAHCAQVMEHIKSKHSAGRYWRHWDARFWVGFSLGGRPLTLRTCHEAAYDS